MSLVLSLHAGQDFFLDDTQVMVDEVLSDQHFRVSCEGKRFDVTDQEATEVLPDVFLSAGDRPQSGIARVAIDAPHDVLILRGERYRHPCVDR